MDPIALLISAVMATMVSALLFVLPGAALGPVVLPGAGSPLERVGRAAGVSLLVTLTTCTVLARMGWLSGSNLLAVVLGATAIGVVARRPRIARWRRARSRRWLAGAGIGGLALLVLIVVPSYLRASPDLLPEASTSWYYLQLARSTADLGAFPVALPEWGAMRPFQTDYLPITAHTAGALLLLPGTDLERLEVYRLLILGLGALFAVLLFRRSVSTWVAVLGAILLLGSVRIEQKFDGYRPETVALVIALFTLWAADRAMAERRPRALVVAAVGAALVFLGHAEIFLVMAPALVGMGIARAVVGQGPTRGLGLRLPTRSGLAAGAVGFSVVAAGLGSGTAAAWLLTGDLGVLEYVIGSDRPAPDTIAERGRPGEVPSGWTFTDDPTWDFYVAAVAPGAVGREPPAGFFHPQLLPRANLVIWPSLDGRTRSGLVVLAALIAAPLLAWPLLDGRRRRWLLAWWVFGGLLIVGSLLLYAVADTYVPQRTAGRRLIPYLALVPIVSATFLLWALGRLVAPFWRAWLPGRPGARQVAAGALLLGLAAGAISAAPTATATADEPDASLSPQGYAAYRWMAEHLPADARILANAYTDGAIAAITGRVGLVDGRAVYLENPTFLAESTALSLGARVVFATPAAAGTATYLARERVTHLVVATQGRTGVDLGGYPLFATDLEALRSDPRFDLIRSFDGDRILLFRVLAAD